MIDDVRIGVAGQVPVTFIGGVSTDDSGFGMGRLLEVEAIRERILALHTGGELSDDPRLRAVQLRDATPPGAVMTSLHTNGPVLDTSDRGR